MVSVVIVSYNTCQITLRCLEAVLASENVDLEIIVVDNNSTDETVEKINKIYRDKDIKIIINNKNLGFGTANNQGMKQSKGEYILLLNSDCFVQPNTIANLLGDNDVVACKLLSEDRSIQPSWGFFPTLRRISLLMLFLDNLPIVREFIDSIHIRAKGRYKNRQQVDWVTGAFVLLKRQVYLDAGGFDENFFMYGEEIEWQYRIRKQGYQIWYEPKAAAVHLLGASSPTRAPAIIGEIEGWKYWFSKYHPGWQEKALRLVVFAGCALRIIVKPGLAKFYKAAIFGLTK